MLTFDFSVDDHLVLIIDETETSLGLARSAKCIRTRRVVSDDGTVELELRFHKKHQNWLFSALGV